MQVLTVNKNTDFFFSCPVKFVCSEVQFIGENPGFFQHFQEAEMFLFCLWHEELNQLCSPSPPKNQETSRMFLFSGIKVQIVKSQLKMDTTISFPLKCWQIGKSWHKRKSFKAKQFRTWQGWRKIYGWAQSFKRQYSRGCLWRGLIYFLYICSFGAFL